MEADDLDVVTDESVIESLIFSINNCLHKNYFSFYCTLAGLNRTSVLKSLPTPHDICTGDPRKHLETIDNVLEHRRAHRPGFQIPRFLKLRLKRTKHFLQSKIYFLDELEEVQNEYRQEQIDKQQRQLSQQEDLNKDDIFDNDIDYEDEDNTIRPDPGQQEEEESQKHEEQTFQIKRAQQHPVQIENFLSMHNKAITQVETSQVSGNNDPHSQQEIAPTKTPPPSNIISPKSPISHSSSNSPTSSQPQTPILFTSRTPPIIAAAISTQPVNISPIPTTNITSSPTVPDSHSHQTSFVPHPVSPTTATSNIETTATSSNQSPILITSTLNQGYYQDNQLNSYESQNHHHNQQNRYYNQQQQKPYPDLINNTRYENTLEMPENSSQNRHIYHNNGNMVNHNFPPQQIQPVGPPKYFQPLFVYESIILEAIMHSLQTCYPRFTPDGDISEEVWIDAFKTWERIRVITNNQIGDLQTLKDWYRHKLHVFRIIHYGKTVPDWQFIPEEYRLQASEEQINQFSKSKTYRRQAFQPFPLGPRFEEMEGLFPPNSKYNPMAYTKSYYNKRRVNYPQAGISNDNNGSSANDINSKNLPSIVNKDNNSANQLLMPSLSSVVPAANSQNEHKKPLSIHQPQPTQFPIIESQQQPQPHEDDQSATQVQQQDQQRSIPSPRPSLKSQSDNLTKNVIVEEANNTRLSITPINASNTSIPLNSSTPAVSLSVTSTPPQHNIISSNNENTNSGPTISIASTPSRYSSTTTNDLIYNTNESVTNTSADDEESNHFDSFDSEETKMNENYAPKSLNVIDSNEVNSNLDGETVRSDGLEESEIDLDAQDHRNPSELELIPEEGEEEEEVALISKDVESKLKVSQGDIAVTDDPDRFRDSEHDLTVTRNIHPDIALQLPPSAQSDPSNYEIHTPDPNSSPELDSPLNIQNSIGSNADQNSSFNSNLIKSVDNQDQQPLEEPINRTILEPNSNSTSNISHNPFYNSLMAHKLSQASLLSRKSSLGKASKWDRIDEEYNNNPSSITTTGLVEEIYNCYIDTPTQTMTKLYHEYKDNERTNLEDIEGSPDLTRITLPTTTHNTEYPAAVASGASDMNLPLNPITSNNNNAPYLLNPHIAEETLKLHGKNKATSVASIVSIPSTANINPNRSSDSSAEIKPTADTTENHDPTADNSFQSGTTTNSSSSGNGARNKYNASNNTMVFSTPSNKPSLNSEHDSNLGDEEVPKAPATVSFSNFLDPDASSHYDKDDQYDDDASMIALYERSSISPSMSIGSEDLSRPQHEYLEGEEYQMLLAAAANGNRTRSLDDSNAVNSNQQKYNTKNFDDDDITSSVNLLTSSSSSIELINEYERQYPQFPYRSALSFFDSVMRGHISEKDIEAVHRYIIKTPHVMLVIFDCYNDAEALLLVAQTILRLEKGRRRLRRKKVEKGKEEELKTSTTATTPTTSSAKYQDAQESPMDYHEYQSIKNMNRQSTHVNIVEIPTAHHTNNLNMNRLNNTNGSILNFPNTSGKINGIEHFGEEESDDGKFDDASSLSSPPKPVSFSIKRKVHSMLLPYPSSSSLSSQNANGKEKNGKNRTTTNDTTKSIKCK